MHVEQWAACVTESVIGKAPSLAPILAPSPAYTHYAN